MLVLVLLAFSSFGVLHDFDFGAHHPDEGVAVAVESDSVPHAETVCALILVGIVVAGAGWFRSHTTAATPLGVVRRTTVVGVVGRVRAGPPGPRFLGFCPILA